VLTSGLYGNVIDLDTTRCAMVVVSRFIIEIVEKERTDDMACVSHLPRSMLVENGGVNSWRLPTIINRALGAFCDVPCEEPYWS